jgi:uncharacterized protein (DUF2147 family)
MHFLFLLAADLTGLWLTPEGLSKIEIKNCDAGQCGSIVWMKSPKNDEKNADPALKGRPLLGAQIVNGNKIYAPERGKWMDAKLVLTSPDSLEVRVSAGMVKKTVVWTRAK